MASTNSVDITDIDLQKLWFVLKRRWLAGMVVLFVTIVVAGVASIRQEHQYEATGKLLFKINRTPTLTGVGEEITDLDALEQNANPIITEIEVIESIPIVQKTIAALELELTNQNIFLTPKQLQSKLMVKPVVGADVLTVSYQSTNPQLAVAVVNQVMDTYIEHSIMANRGNVVNAQKLINEELPQAKAQVDRVEEALQQFKEKHQIAVIEAQAKAAVEKMTELEQQIAQVQTQLQKAQVLSAALQEQLGMDAQQALTLATLSQSTKVQETLQKLQQVQNQLAEERTIFREQQPTVVLLQEEEAAFKNILRQRIQEVLGSEKQVSIGNLQRGELHQNLTSKLVATEAEKLALASELEQLQKIQSNYQQRLNLIPQLQRAHRELQQQLVTARSNYEMLSQKLQEARLAAQQDIGNVRIIEPAQLETKDRTKLNVLLGATLGTLLAIATMTFLELRDRSLKTIQEVKHRFTYPLLGTIPTFSKALVNLPVVEMPYSPSSEAFRILQAKLKFLGNEEAPKVIVVSSAVPQEGKSIVSANLALNLSQIGQKVLIIDSNLRQPSQQDIWQLNKDYNPGLSDVILEKKNVDLVIQSVAKNLDLLFSGNALNNPLAVINSQEMELLMEDLAQVYDFILIDSPPLLGVADTLSLGELADGILLVSRLGVLDDYHARECQDLLKITEQNIIGLVINGVDIEKGKHYYSQKTLPPTKVNNNKLIS